MDPGPPSCDPEAKMFSFFLHKRDQDSVLCGVAMEALENAVQSSDLSEPTLTRIFDAPSAAHRTPRCPEVERWTGRIQQRAGPRAIDLRRHRTVTLDYPHAWSHLKPIPSHGGWRHPR